MSRTWTDGGGASTSNTRINYTKQTNPDINDIKSFENPNFMIENNISWGFGVPNKTLLAFDFSVSMVLLAIVYNARSKCELSFYEHWNWRFEVFFVKYLSVQIPPKTDYFWQHQFELYLLLVSRLASKQSIWKMESFIHFEPFVALFNQEKHFW